jgi:hypothetical protein
MTKLVEKALPLAGIEDLADHWLFTGSYSHKSLENTGPLSPVPKYPLFPIPNPTALNLTRPGKGAFVVH